MTVRRGAPQNDSKEVLLRMTGQRTSRNDNEGGCPSGCHSERSQCHSEPPTVILNLPTVIPNRSEESEISL